MMKLTFKFEAIGYTDLLYSVTKHVDALNYEKIGILKISKPDKFGTMMIEDIETIFKMDDLEVLKNLLGKELTTEMN